MNLASPQQLKQVGNASQTFPLAQPCPTHASNESCKGLCSLGWLPPPSVLLLALAQQLSPTSRFTYK